MKNIDNAFKEQLTKLGRQIDSKIITPTQEINANSIYNILLVTKGTILKSMMKELDFEITQELDVGTEIEYKFGILVNTVYTYLSYGKFIIYSKKYNEDTKTYSYIAYDYMLKTMIEYEQLKNGKFPMTLASFLQNICTDLGMSLKSTNFANSTKMLSEDVYANLNYTYRDVLDEISACTGGSICIDLDEKLEVRYPNYTNETIDEHYFKDINVAFGKVYGPINSIVLSRAAESDNVYIQDEVSVQANGLCEIKIIDNQILNNNNRSDYLEELLEKLNGLTYSINDYSSTGIVFFDFLDYYTVLINEKEYSCLMLNDEININQGLEESVYSKEPKETITDYTKSDKTDRKINKTYLIVDKQNKKIEAVVSDVGEQNEKISKVTQTLDKLQSEISEIADVTNSISGNGSVELKNVNASEPIRIEIRPIGEDISYLYPSNTLYPADNLYLKNRKLRFENTNGYAIEWELPDDLLYYDSEHYDELILDYTGQSCVINKKVERNADGSKYLLTTPTTVSYSYPTIPLEAGDYTINLLGYNTAYLFARLMIQNIYTDQFATKAEMNSSITQTKEQIDLNVNKKLSNYSTTTQMNSAINLKADSITNSVSKTYSTKSETEAAKAQATSNANTATDNKLKNYSTTVEMNSAIEQKADSITSSVSKTYSTKTETANAKTEAINSANANTNNKLKDYSTTIQMNSAIEQKANSITSTVKATYETKADASKNYATKEQLSTAQSQIKQTTDAINLSVNKKVGNDEIISKINQSAESVAINANKLSLNGKIINLTGDNIAISSNYLNIDKNRKYDFLCTSD